MDSYQARIDGKKKARQLALDWWRSNDAAREKGYATCDSCSAKIPPDEGYLCNPGLLTSILPSPDLVCETCFDQYSYEPWDPARVRQMATNLQAVEQRARQRTLLQRVSDSRFADWLLNPYGDDRYRIAAFMADIFALLTALGDL